jgi:SAM-dependent methyltransferase
LEVADRIIVCYEAPYNGQWFHVKNGVKRLITSEKAATDNQIDTSNIEKVSAEEANSYRTGMQIFKTLNSVDEITNYFEARAYLLKDLNGYGIEFGAATSPCTVPDSCNVEYADFFHKDEGCNNAYDGDFVPVKFFTSLDEMSGISNDSLDFLISSHVIEHVPRTLLALERCFNRLKKGGILFMAIPHMNYTFDMLRPLTKIEHFIEDYNNYVRERDLLHIVDYVEYTREYERKKLQRKIDHVDVFPLLDYFMNGASCMIKK